MSKKVKIGIFGGTFNPPHLGHRRLALTAADSLGLDRVLIMPACIPPHKQPVSLAGAEDRVRMCTLGLLCDARFEVSTLEIERGEKSYTIDTLEALSAQIPEAELYLITGSDMLATFREWRSWERILEKAYLCAVSREKGFLPELSGFTPEQKAKIIYLETEPYEMSSTFIRDRLSAGEPVQDCLTEEVARYIEETGLYTDRFPEYRRLAEERLDAKRYHHSLCVSRAARQLAFRYGADPDKAQAAGLLHDVMKNAPPQEQQAVIAEGGHALTACENANRKVWHAIAGEAFLRLHAGVTDEEILGAVRWHTTGKAGMTLLEKIVYMADFISDDRTYPDVSVVRELAFRNPDEAILYTASYTIKKLAEAGQPLHTATVDCYNSALIALGRGEPCGKEGTNGIT